jgi:hypothetical protein
MCVCHARSLGNAVNRCNRCAVHQKRGCAAEAMTVLIWGESRTSGHQPVLYYYWHVFLLAMDARAGGAVCAQHDSIDVRTPC